MKSDQVSQAIPRGSGSRDDVVQAAVESVQAAADVGDHVQEKTVPLASLQGELPAEQEDRQADDHQQRQPQQIPLHRRRCHFQGRYASCTLIATWRVSSEDSERWTNRT